MKDDMDMTLPTVGIRLECLNPFQKYEVEEHNEVKMG